MCILYCNNIKINLNSTACQNQELPARVLPVLRESRFHHLPKSPSPCSLPCADHLFLCEVGANPLTLEAHPAPRHVQAELEKQHTKVRSSLSLCSAAESNL